MNQPNTRHGFLRFAIIIPALVAVLAFAAPADAADASDAPDHVKLLRDHLRAKDGDGIKDELNLISAAYGRTAGKVTRTRMLAAVGQALRMKNEDIQSAALDAFEEMKDPDAWRHYGSFLKRSFKKEFPRLSSQAMDVTRALTPDAAIAPLLLIVKKSKNLAAAAKAVETLGAYRQSRRRMKILAALIAATQKEKPGVRGRDNTVVYGPRSTGEQARNRWHALARPMVVAANELTGQDYASAEDWFDAWRTYKRKPRELFRDEGE